MDPGLLFALAVIIAVAVAVSAFLLQRRRREELQQVAAELGFRYNGRDPFGLLALPFRLLEEGDGRKIENVLWGTSGGRTAYLFDFWYYDEHRDAEGNVSRSYERFSCAAFEIEASCPHI